MSETREYRVIEVNLEHLQGRIEKLNKRARKLGCQEIQVQVTNEEFIQVGMAGSDFTETVKMLTVTVTGEAPVIAGWKFVATLQHEQTGTILRTVRGEEIPERYREADASVCEHCNTRRKRKDTYVVKNVENGEFKQVGRAEEIYNAPQSIWAVEQLDQDFSFGDALLEKTDNKLILNIDGMKLDVSFLEDKLISTKYIGKLVLFGAHCEDFEQNGNGVECDVEISFGKSNGEYISYLSNDWRIKSKEKFEGQVKIAPKADKLFLFDKVSENSILK